MASSAASMPRVRSAASTISMRSSLRALAFCERMSGSSSGFVPSRAPIANATRSSARHATSDIGASVSARWISSARHPGNARLDGSSRYASPCRTWMASPGARRDASHGTSTQISGKPLSL